MFPRRHLTLLGVAIFAGTGAFAGSGQASDFVANDDLAFVGRKAAVIPVLGNDVASGGNLEIRVSVIRPPAHGNAYATGGSLDYFPPPFVAYRRGADFNPLEGDTFSYAVVNAGPQIAIFPPPPRFVFGTAAVRVLGWEAVRGTFTLTRSDLYPDKPDIFQGGPNVRYVVSISGDGAYTLTTIVSSRGTSRRSERGRMDSTAVLLRMIPEIQVFEPDFHPVETDSGIEFEAVIPDIPLSLNGQFSTHSERLHRVRKAGALSGNYRGRTMDQWGKKLALTFAISPRGVVRMVGRLDGGRPFASSSELDVDAEGNRSFTLMRDVRVGHGTEERISGLIQAIGEGKAWIGTIYRDSESLPFAGERSGLRP